MGAHNEVARGRGAGAIVGARRVGGGRRGFTLIELLVVIGIIAVLAAIVIPVYARAQEKGRQATCISNMHAIGMAIKIYQLDNKGYPVDYDPVTGDGGVTALYLMDYLSSSKVLRCPDDQATLEQYMTRYAAMKTTVHEWDAGSSSWVDNVYTGPTIMDEGTPGSRPAWDLPANTGQYFRAHYSSYNCPSDVDPKPDAGGNATVDYQLYNRFGYNGIGWRYGLSHLPAPPLAPPLADADPTRKFLSTSIKFAGLSNGWAPDETIITHCPYHRDYFGRPAAYQDVIVRVGGDAGLRGIASYDWINQPGD